MKNRETTSATMRVCSRMFTQSSEDAALQGRGEGEGVFCGSEVGRLQEKTFEVKVEVKLEKNSFELRG